MSPTGDAIDKKRSVRARRPADVHARDHRKVDDEIRLMKEGMPTDEAAGVDWEWFAVIGRLHTAHKRWDAMSDDAVRDECHRWHERQLNAIPLLGSLMHRYYLAEVALRAGHMGVYLRERKAVGS